MYTLKADWVFPVKKEVTDLGMSLGWSANTADWDVVTHILGEVDNVSVNETEDGFTLRAEDSWAYSPRIVVEVKNLQAKVFISLEVLESHECDWPHRLADRAGDDYNPWLATSEYLGWCQFLKRLDVPFEADMVGWEEFPPVEIPRPRGRRSLVAYWAGKALGLY